MRPVVFFLLTGAALLFGIALMGCAGDDDKRRDDREDAVERARSGVETFEEDGYLVKRYALGDDTDQKQLTKYFEEYKDPDDDSVTKRRLRKKEVDLNSDGKVNLVREYDEDENIRKERLDRDLDGVFDVIRYYDDEELARKELLDDEGEEVVEVRHYADDKITRIEKDRNQDGEPDYWEFYEQGRLDRIGRDQDGDGSADNWTRR